MIVESTNVENMHKSPAFAKPLLGVVKEKRTSLFYGVRLDKRLKGEVETIWYRSEIEAENKKYYLGAYVSEQMAGYAFNVGFNFLNNGKYTIENKVDLNNEEKTFIYNKVRKLMLKRGLIHYA
ncbi:MAG: hypothetical protein KA319_14405 [Ferruginibacter sp.]|nr:hypothetical protein [Ferruginibacter sp.]